MKLGAAASRALYMAVLFLSIVVALTLRYTGHDILINVKGFEEHIDCETCVGNEAVYRFAFTLTCFFGTTGLLTLIAPSFHFTAWLIKFVGYVGLLVGTFYMQDNVFDVFSDVARYGAIVFLCIQLLLLVDFAYSWNEGWIKRDEAAGEESSKWHCAIVLAAFVLFSGAITLHSLAYLWFGGTGCDGNTAIITFSMLAVFGFTVLSLSAMAPHGTLLTSGVVSANVSFLLFSGLSSLPEEECNSLLAMGSGMGDSLSMWGGLMITAIALVFSAYSAATQRDVFHTARKNSKSFLHEPLKLRSASDEFAPRAPGDEEAGTASQSLPAHVPAPVAAVSSSGTDAEDAAEKARQEQAAEEEAAEIASGGLPSFHLVLCLASMYMAMLLTDWGAAADGQRASTGTQSGWVKLVSSWLTCALYVWTLLAPRLFPDREF